MKPERYESLEISKLWPNPIWDISIFIDYCPKAESYPPCLEVVTVHNLRTRRAMVIGGPLNVGWMY
jgi:hypothetical protein